MIVAKQSQHDETPASPYNRLVELRARVSWPLLVITLEGIGFVGLTLALWVLGFDVIGEAPLLIVLVVLWLIAEVLVWSVGDWT